ncbi:DUF4352 domain-containing protein [Paenibacillus mucilaginosus]|uniref:DUF4352 domain-containing protein n=1 Tax=Paenibacillus mucilaginosus TaxID=61624 RepID=UPI0002FB82FF
MKKIWNKSLLYALAVTTALGSIALPSSARAGKEGVFLANDTYFTLERVSVASGSSSLMQFTLKLHNGSSSVIDFNRYGVRVLDAAGNRYPARLTGKLSARVQPGADQEFPFYSELGNLPSAEGLKVDLFEWNGSGTDGIRDIGALNASVDVPAAAEPGTQAVISLQDADTSLDSEGFVTVKRGDAYETVESGKRYLYVDLAFKNDSGSDLTLPSALQYRLRDAQGYSYEGSLLTGDSSVLPSGRYGRAHGPHAGSDGRSGGVRRHEPAALDRCFRRRRSACEPAGGRSFSGDGPWRRARADRQQ